MAHVKKILYKDHLARTPVQIHFLDWTIYLIFILYVFLYVLFESPVYKLWALFCNYKINRFPYYSKWWIWIIACYIVADYHTICYIISFFNVLHTDISKNMKHLAALVARRLSLLFEFLFVYLCLSPPRPGPTPVIFHHLV